MKRYIKSTIDFSISAETFMNLLVDIYHKKFPDSLCNTTVVNSTYKLAVNAYLRADLSEIGNNCQNEPFGIGITITCPNISSYKDIWKSDISLQDTLCMNVSGKYLGSNYGGALSYIVEHIIPLPDASDCGLTVEHKNYYGNYESILSFWARFIDNLYDMVVQLRDDNNLPKSITENSILMDRVNAM